MRKSPRKCTIIRSLASRARQFVSAMWHPYNSSPVLGSYVVEPKRPHQLADPVYARAQGTPAIQW
jgi:hypothetical protein